MKKKILLVEDDELLREAIATVLNKKYTVAEASNGKEAKNIITLTKFDIIISDVQMPFLTGIELLEWVKENHPTKFILMTGFSHVLETQKASELGATDFLAKPFEDSELLKKIEIHIGSNEIISDTPINIDSNYCKVPIDDFVADKEFQYDLYIKIGSDKYLKIAHKGGKIPADRARMYKEKGVHYFYVHKNDFGKLVGFTLFLSKAVAHSQKLDRAKKERFVRYTGEMILQHAFVNNLDENCFAIAKDFTIMSLETLSEDSQILNLLTNLNDHADFLYAHGLAVSTFSVMIASVLGWSRPTLLFNLSMAGLFHDIGKKEIPREILEKPRAEISIKERELIETHPIRGREIIESMKGIPSEVGIVAFEHHENITGTGYPRQISKNQIHPLTHIISAANIFANYTVKNPKFPKSVNAREALMLMKQNFSGLIDPISFEALNSVVIKQK